MFMQMKGPHRGGQEKPGTWKWALLLAVGLYALLVSVVYVISCYR